MKKTKIFLKQTLWFQSWKILESLNEFIVKESKSVDSQRAGWGQDEIIKGHRVNIGATDVLFRMVTMVSWIYMYLIQIPEKAMAPHSSTLAWKIPWAEEPGGLQSLGSLRIGHNWATSLSLFTFMHWRRKWQPTPVFLPGESQGWGSLVGCCLWGRTESDTTEVT